MKTTSFKAADFTLEGAVYVSPPVQLEESTIAIEVIVPEEATVKIQKALTTSRFYDIADSEMTIAAQEFFNLSNGKKGQFVRIVSTVVPTLVNVLS